MHLFRSRLHHLALLAVAWFALNLGVALAAPLVAPVVYDTICSADGTTVVAHEQGSGAALEQQHIKCALCLLLAPPQAQASPWLHPRPQGPALPANRANPPPRLTASAPLPPRGPPSHT